MANPASAPPVKVGVVLAPRWDGLGEWLADGAAFEAAGADALWVDSASSPELDPLALAAALAAVTYRSLVVTALPVADDRPSAAGRILATIGRLSHDRLRVVADADPAEGHAELASTCGVFRRIHDDPATFELMGEADQAERWVSTPSPDGRAAWRAALLDAAERGTHGLLVAADPRVLDILRNPDDRGGRRDLHLAQG